MLVYLQLCLVLIVLRFPVWIIIQNMLISDDLSKQLDEMEHKASITNKNSTKKQETTNYMQASEVEMGVGDHVIAPDSDITDLHSQSKRIKAEGEDPKVSWSTVSKCESDINEVKIDVDPMQDIHVNEISTPKEKVNVSGVEGQGPANRKNSAETKTNMESCRYKDTTDSRSTRSDLWVLAVSRFKKKQKASEQIMDSSSNAIDICFYGFVEGADAFSFVDEVLEERNYFAANKVLTHLLLFFISLTLLLPSVTNFLSLSYKSSKKVKLATKLGVAIMSNAPFFVIRMYLFSLYGEVVEGSRNTMFLLFTIKELVTLLLVAVEVGMEIFANRKPTITPMRFKC